MRSKWEVRVLVIAALVALLSGRGAPLYGAPQRGQGPATPRTPRAAAPFDLTGTWVSVVTEDWRWRMVMPAKGDYSSVPLTAEGRKVADAWDPSKLASDGCKPFGAAAVMRVPGRVRIAWENESTLKIETDAGQQTRLLRFDPPSRAGATTRFGEAGTTPSSRTWQGDSVAVWDVIRQPGGAGVSLQAGAGRVGALKVVTTNMRAGYLRRNGVPYSENAVMIEYFDRLSAYGTDWLTVLTVIEDPQYLNQPFVTSTHFKREADASRWAPTPCENGK